MKKTNPSINPLSQTCNNPSIADTRHKRIDPPKESYSSQSAVDARQKRIEPPNFDPHKQGNEQKHGGMSWSVLKHRQIDSAENCDKPNPCVIESSNRPSSDRQPHDYSSKMDYSREPPSRDGLKLVDCSRNGIQSDTFNNKAKRNAKDPRSFPLSLMKPKMTESKKTSDSQQQNSKTDILRQRPVQRARLGRFSSDHLANPLSAIEQIKTEESIQEWLARISESAGAEDGERSAWGSKKERQQASKSNKLLRTEATNVLHKGLQVRNHRTLLSFERLTIGFSYTRETKFKAIQYIYIQSTVDNSKS